MSYNAEQFYEEIFKKRFTSGCFFWLLMKGVCYLRKKLKGSTYEFFNFFKKEVYKQLFFVLISEGYFI